MNKAVNNNDQSFNTDYSLGLCDLQRNAIVAKARRLRSEELAKLLRLTAKGAAKLLRLSFAALAARINNPNSPTAQPLDSHVSEDAPRQIHTGAPLADTTAITQKAA